METFKTIGIVLILLLLWLFGLYIRNLRNRNIYGGKDAESYRRKKRY